MDKLSIDLIVNHFYKYANLFLCNNVLYAYSTYNYLTKGAINMNLPKVNFMVCSSDEGYSKILLNIDLYIIISHQTKEYFLCTLKQLLPMLYDMHGRFKRVVVYPYTAPECLVYYGLSGYNFAITNYELQTTNNKYICDVSDLKNHKYTRQQKFMIAESLGLQIYKNVSNNELDKIIYEAM